MRSIALVFGAAALVLAATAAGASGLRVSPVGFEVEPSQAAASLTLDDDGAAAMTVQMRVFRWTQTASGDVLEPTREIVASPPFAELTPGAEQTVRIVRLGPAPAAEAAYRVLVDELPPASAPQGHTVTLLMRHSIPVFLEGPQGGAAKLDWSAAVFGQALRLRGVNSGGRRIRLANVKVFDAAGRQVAEQAGLAGYVLAQSAVQFMLPLAPGAATSPVRMTAETDQGRVDVALAPLAS